MTSYLATAINPHPGGARASPGSSSRCYGPGCAYQGRVCGWSPHLLSNPTDKQNPSPDVLPPEARDLWQKTYANADRYYQGAWDMPEMTAWRAVKMRYPNGVGNWKPSGQSSLVARLKRNKAVPPTELATPSSDIRMPDPGETIVLGRVLEYVVMEDPPGLDVYRFKDEASAPKLLWSPSQKSLIILPATAISDELDPDLSGLERTADLYRAWSWGQEPRGFTPFRTEDYPMKPVGMADTIVYRSGKGSEVRDDPVGVQEYVHQHGDGVVAYAAARDKNGTPKAIMIRGGNLDVLAPGIVN